MSMPEGLSGVPYQPYGTKRWVKLQSQLEQFSYRRVTTNTSKIGRVLQWPFTIRSDTRLKRVGDNAKQMRFWIRSLPI